MRRLKRIFLACLFILSLLLSSIFPHLSTKPVRAESIPTLIQNYNGYQVLIPDWNRITWSNLPPVEQGGSISIPGNLVQALGYDPSRAWVAGQSPDTIVMLGDVASVTGLEKFALRQVQEITGIDLNQMSLKDFQMMNWQSIASLTKAIPGLKDLPVDEVKVAYDLFNSVSSGQLATVLEEFDSASIGDILDFNPSWGEVPLGDVLNLSNYNLVGSIPGLIFSPIDTLSNWGQSLISQVPGLGMVPFSMFPLGFNLGAGAVAIADIVWSDAEYGDPSLNDAYFVSGEASGGSTVPKRCAPGKSCAYLELSDLLGSNGPFYGKRWVSGNSQQVSGGEGLLKVVNGGKEPTGVMVYGNLFKVVLTGTDESTGTAKFGLYLRACPPPIFPYSKKLGCSPYFIGAIPWIPASEKQLVVIGGVNAPSINVPKQYQQQIDEVIAQYQPSPISPTTPNYCNGCVAAAGDGITTGQFVNPIANGTRISSGYGWRIRPLTEQAQFHAGIDLAAPMGTPVKSVDGGVVVRVSSNSCPDWGDSWNKRNCGGQMGNWVDIQHNNGLITRYGHLQQGSVQVKVGMKVSQGQAIAAVGSSGWSTGPHLDLRVYDGQGNYLNPSKFVPK